MQSINQNQEADPTAASIWENRLMSNWKVLYRDHFDQDRSSRANPSKEAALREARDLYRNHRAQIYRLEGPNGQIVPGGRVMSWVQANR